MTALPTVTWISHGHTVTVAFDRARRRFVWWVVPPGGHVVNDRNPEPARWSPPARDPRRQAHLAGGVVTTYNQDRARRRAHLLMSSLAGRYRSSTPLGVTPSRGMYGSAADWDVFTSMCDARTALVLAMGRRPDPCTGHVLHDPEPVGQLELFGAAA